MKALHRLLQVCPLFVALSGLPCVAAQEPSVPLTFAGALSRVAERNPGLTAQQLSVRANDGLIEQAGYRPNPTLDVTMENFLGTGNVQGVRGLEATVSANQTLERAGKRAKRVTLASREREIAEAEFAVTQRELVTSAALAYIELLASQARMGLAEEAQQLAKSAQAAIDEQVKGGAASPADGARARIEVAVTQGELARAQAAHLAARSHLAALWGGSATDIANVVGTIRIPESLPDQHGLLAQLNEHPLLKLHQAQIEVQRAALDLERSHSTQDISVGGGVRFLRDGNDAALVAGVSVPLAIRNRNQGNIRSARDRLAAAEERLRATENELRTRSHLAWEEVAATYATAMQLRRDVLPATEDALALARQAHNEGQLPQTDVLDAERGLTAIRREIIDADSACLSALVRAEALTAPHFPLTGKTLSLP